MSDNQNSLPAGGENAPAVPASVQSTASDPTSVLDAYWEGDPGERPDASAEDDRRTEPAEIETAPEPEGEDGAEIEAAEDNSLEGPEDDASETEPTDASSDDDESGTRMHRLRDGSQVSLSDLKKGYGEFREFREKVIPQVQQRLAQADQIQRAVAAERAQFQQTQAQLAAFLQQAIPPEVGDDLWESDPIEAQRLDRKRTQAIMRFQQANAQNAQMLQRQQQEAAAARQAYMQEQTRLLAAAMPDLRDQAKARAFHDDFQRVAARVGFSPQETSQVYDHRLYKLAQLAIKGMRAEESERTAKATVVQKQQIAAKKVAKAPPVSAPAARQPAAVRENLSARGALERLRKSGSPRDAEDFLSRFE